MIELTSNLGPLRLRTATPADRSFIDHWSARFGEFIGHVPRVARAQRLDQGAYLLAEIEQEPVGFLLLGGGQRAPLRLSQIAVLEDLWRNGLGSICIRHLQTRVERTGLPLVASVAATLPMNEVARVTGGVHVASSLARGKRGRALQHWVWGEGEEPCSAWLNRYEQRRAVQRRIRGSSARAHQAVQPDTARCSAPQAR